MSDENNFESEVKQHSAQDTAETIHSTLNAITPLSKYLAMVLFILLPFLGGWIGYQYGESKVIEIDRVTPINICEFDTVYKIGECECPIKHLERLDEVRNELLCFSEGLPSDILDYIDKLPSSSVPANEVILPNGMNLAEYSELRSISADKVVNLNLPSFPDILEWSEVEPSQVYYIYTTQVEDIPLTGKYYRAETQINDFNDTENNVDYLAELRLSPDWSYKVNIDSVEYTATAADGPNGGLSGLLKQTSEGLVQVVFSEHYGACFQWTETGDSRDRKFITPCKKTYEIFISDPVPILNSFKIMESGIVLTNPQKGDFFTTYDVQNGVINGRYEALYGPNIFGGSHYSFYPNLNHDIISNRIKLVTDASLFSIDLSGLETSGKDCSLTGEATIRISEYGSLHRAVGMTDYAEVAEVLTYKAPTDKECW